MPRRRDEFLRQARVARERAAESRDEFRDQWLCVAEMWDLLAKECSRFRNPAPDETEMP
jgi:hypothetical protein